jgi:uncharacterized damage-inducible protein DinB
MTDPGDPEPPEVEMNDPTELFRPEASRWGLTAYLERLFDHVRWADRRVLDLLRESAAARQPETMRLYSHLLAAERVWLLRLNGEDSSVQSIWPELGLEEMEAMQAANEAGYDRYLRDRTEAELDREIEYRTSTGVPFRTTGLDILSQVALHGSYHRGQLARAVRAAGGEPVNTDFIVFAREQS